MMVHSLHVENYIAIAQCVTTLLAAGGTIYLANRSLRASRVANEISERASNNAIEDRLFDMAKIISNNLADKALDDIDNLYTKLVLFCQLAEKQKTSKEIKDRAFDAQWALLSPAIWDEIRKSEAANTWIATLEDMKVPDSPGSVRNAKLQNHIETLKGQMGRVQREFAATSERYGEKISVQN